MSPRGPASALEHPDTQALDLLRVLHALADPTRIEIVRALREGGERACGTFPVDVAASTLSHHFKVLREAGVIHQRAEGRERMTALRAVDLAQRFPGLIDLVIDLHQTAPPAPNR